MKEKNTRKFVLSIYRGAFVVERVIILLVWNEKLDTVIFMEHE